MMDFRVIPPFLANSVSVTPESLPLQQGGASAPHAAAPIWPAEGLERAWRIEPDRIQVSVLDLGFLKSLEQDLVAELVGRLDPPASRREAHDVALVNRAVKRLVEDPGQDPDARLADLIELQGLQARSSGDESLAGMFDRLRHVFISAPALEDDFYHLLAMTLARRAAEREREDGAAPLHGRMVEALDIKQQCASDYLEAHRPYVAARERLVAHVSALAPEMTRDLLDFLGHQWAEFEAHLQQTRMVPTESAQARLERTIDELLFEARHDFEMVDAVGGASGLRALLETLPAADISDFLARSEALVAPRQRLCNAGLRALDLRAELLALRRNYVASGRTEANARLVSAIAGMVTAFPPTALDPLIAKVGLLVVERVLESVDSEGFFARPPVSLHSGLDGVIAALRAEPLNPDAVAALDQVALRFAAPQCVKWVEELRCALCHLRQIGIDEQLASADAHSINFERIDWVRGDRRWVNVEIPDAWAGDLKAPLGLLVRGLGVEVSLPLLESVSTHQQEIARLIGCEADGLERVVASLREGVESRLEPRAGEAPGPVVRDQIARSLALVSALVNVACSAQTRHREGLWVAAWAKLGNYPVHEAMHNHHTTNTLARRNEASRLAVDAARWIAWTVVPVCEAMLAE